MVVAIETTRRTLAVDFSEYSYEDAVKEVGAVADNTYLTARLFFEGDHWQDGEAWAGPHPAANDPEAALVWGELERNLVAHPAIEEVTNRHRDAVIGQEPFWSFTVRRPLKPGEKPSDEEQILIDEAEALLTEWWDSKDPLDVLQKAVEDLVLGGRGIIRLFIPEGELQADDDGATFVPDGPMAAQLERIWPTFVPADEGAVPVDPITMNRFGVFVYDISDANGTATKFAELTYLDPSTKETVIRTVVEQNAADIDVPEPTKLQLGGRLMMHEMRAHPLITEPVLSNQRMLNKCLTMRSINVDLGGFLERVILNGQLPGEFEEKDGRKVFVPDKFEVGAGTTNTVVGVQIGTKEDGTPIIADPRIQYREPVDVTTFDKSELAAYKNVLTATRQLHVLISGDANASGEARKQARDDFTKSGKRTKTRLDNGGRWLLESTLQIGATLAKTPNKFATLRAVFDSQLDPGPLSADDRAAIVSEVTSQPPLRSQEGGMALLGVTDTRAEQLRIQSEQEAAAQVTPIQKQQIERGQIGIDADKKALSTQPGGPGVPPTAGA